MNIEQTVSAAVAGLQLGSTFTLDDLLTAVRARRNRRVRNVVAASCGGYTPARYEGTSYSTRSAT